MLHRSIIAAALLAGLAGPVLAHHGISNWDLNRDLSITGTVKRMELINPHSWIYLEVKGADGKAVEWRCEMRSANSLRRSGWTADMFQVGSTITVTGSPERTRANWCYLGTITFADGSHMDRYGQRQLSASAGAAARTPARAARLPSGLPNLGGDWAAEQRVMTDPRGQLGTLVLLSDAAKLKPGELPAGQQPFPGARGSPASLASDPIKAAWDRPTPVKLTPRGEQARRAFNPSTRQNPRLRCEPTNILFDWTFDSVVNRVTQTPTLIRMHYGHMDLQREVHLGKPAPAGTKPSLAGYSAGRWEGDTLVVVTDHFAPGVLNADAYMLHGTQLRITERFTLDSTGTKLTRVFVAEDPQFMAEPWRGQDVVSVADVPFEPYRCDDPGGAPGEQLPAGR